MNKLILTGILCFSCLFSFSQEISKTDSTSTLKDSRIDQLNKTYKSSYKLKGYRIQIYSGDKRGQRETRLAFTQSYKTIKAHESYGQPYFKVRVGDFRTKLEAIKFKNELINHFPICFIVNNVDIEITELIK